MTWMTLVSSDLADNRHNMNGQRERVVAACVGGLITCGVMYVAVVGRYVNRVEVSQMIQVESPYIRDAKWIERELSSLSGKMDSVNEKLDTLLSR